VKQKKTKKKYRVRNWREYNKALVRRGSLTLWIDEHSLKAWRSTARGRRGRPPLYADLAIRCALTLRAVYHLPLRATEGLVGSLLRLLHADLPAPHFSTLCRRAATLQIGIPRQRAAEPIHLVIDSSGLKIFGEGEWKTRFYEIERRRTWRKLHIGVNAQTGEVVAAALSDNELLDRQAMPELLSQVDSEIKHVGADGAYDYRTCYEAIWERGAKPLIPPKLRSVAAGDLKMKDRDRNVERAKRLGVKKWKRVSGYHERSLVECAFFRLKTIFSDKLRSREFHRQGVEAFIRCRAMNRMTMLGMPDSYKV
jgi:hypothetical protein